MLGILLLNIVSFALHSGAYFMPAFSLVSSSDYLIWAGVEIFAEGAMRSLFSMLFGAGVALFADTGKTAAVHYRRNFWLLVIGLIDAFVLLWSGDILVNYALAGFVLYFVRNVRASRLLTAAVILLVLLSAMYALMHLGMSQLRDVASDVATSGLEPTMQQQEMISQWEAFKETQDPSPETIAAELEERRAGVLSAYRWHAQTFLALLGFALPVIMFWDALVMMLLGMALYRYGVLKGEQSRGFFVKLSVLGFAVGIAVNATEVYRAYTSDFELLSTFPYLQWTYHLGRLGVALGWLGLIVALLKLRSLQEVTSRLAAVGRMALTNYLMQSLIGLILFTGVGFGWVGQFSRSEIYGFVLAIWVFQLWYSPLWLARYRFGPVEWLWRGLTYGRFPSNRRVTNGVGNRSA